MLVSNSKTIATGLAAAKLSWPGPCALHHPCGCERTRVGLWQQHK